MRSSVRAVVLLGRSTAIEGISRRGRHQGSEVGLIVVTRRALLRLVGAALCCCAPVGAGSTAHAAPSVDSGEAHGELTLPQRRLATLGALMQWADPNAATRAFDFVCAEVRRLGLAATGIVPIDATHACSVLLEETRIRAEFGNGHVQSVGGWVLTRSEAGMCVYLHRLAQRSPGVA